MAAVIGGVRKNVISIHVLHTTYENNEHHKARSRIDRFKSIVQTRASRINRNYIGPIFILISNYVRRAPSNENFIRSGEIFPSNNNRCYCYSRTKRLRGILRTREIKVSGHTPNRSLPPRSCHIKVKCSAACSALSARKAAAGVSSWSGCHRDRREHKTSCVITVSRFLDTVLNPNARFAFGAAAGEEVLRSFGHVCLGVISSCGLTFQTFVFIFIVLRGGSMNVTTFSPFSPGRSLWFKCPHAVLGQLNEEQSHNRILSHHS